MPDPVAGQIVNGYRFRGGNPRDRSSWEPVAASGGSAPSTPPGMARQADGSLWTAPGPRGGAPRRVGGLTQGQSREIGTARQEAALVDPATSDLLRFRNLQQQQPTGGLMGLPFVGSVMGAIDPQVAEMNEIQARLAPAQRQAGSGTMSDRDLALFLQSVPGVARPRQSNEAIIDRGLQEGGRRIERARFLENYGRQYGTLDGSTEAWGRQYNPPPNRPGEPIARANTEPTPAQRQWNIQATRAGTRNREAPIGSRQNPRFVPEGLDVSTIPESNWIVTPSGQLVQAGRARAGSQMRARSGRSSVASVRRVQ